MKKIIKWIKDLFASNKEEINESNKEVDIVHENTVLVRDKVNEAAETYVSKSQIILNPERRTPRKKNKSQVHFYTKSDNVETPKKPRRKYKKKKDAQS